VTVRLRRAGPEDVDFLVELANHEDVEPFMSARRARDAEGIGAELERSRREPQQAGTFVIEVDEDGDWRRAGSLEFDVENPRSRIARLGGLAIHPDFRGRRLADEAARRFQRHLVFDLGYHRLELECYAFNERAIRHAERVGFVLEGRRRRAYWRHGDWVDGVLFGLVREDLETPGLGLLADHVERFNAGVRSGDFGPMLEAFAEDAEMAFEGVPVGPFRGRDAIAAAYRERPPDDEVEVLDAREEGPLVVAAYAWRAEPGVRAGELRLTREGDRIRGLVVTFD
jgi:RimJ/RimL family protein N-acetyltransferase